MPFIVDPNSQALEWLKQTNPSAEIVLQQVWLCQNLHAMKTGPWILLETMRMFAYDMKPEAM